MALVILTPRTEVQVGGWVFDVVTSEAVQSVATVTNYGVEEGVDVSDHIRVEPRTYAISGIVTATPTDPEKQVPDRLVDLLSDLLALQRQEATFELISTLGIIPNVVITNINATYAGSTAGDMLTIELELQEVRFATAQTVNIIQVKLTEKKTCTNLFGDKLPCEQLEAARRKADSLTQEEIDKLEAELFPEEFAERQRPKRIKEVAAVRKEWDAYFKDETIEKSDRDAAYFKLLDDPAAKDIVSSEYSDSTYDPLGYGFTDSAIGTAGPP